MALTTPFAQNGDKLKQFRKPHLMAQLAII